MKKSVFSGIIICALLVQSCVDKVNSDKAMDTGKDPISAEIIGKGHNDGLSFVLARFRSVAPTRSQMSDSEKIAFMKQSIDEFLQSEGYEPFYSSVAIRYSIKVPGNNPEELRADKVDLGLTVRQKAYMDMLWENVAGCYTSEEVKAVVSLLETRVNADTRLSDYERAQLLVGFAVYRYSAEYWETGYGNWSEIIYDPRPLTNEYWKDIVVSDCIWAMEGLRATWACGIPWVIGVGAIGGGLLGSIGSAVL